MAALETEIQVRNSFTICFLAIDEFLSRQREDARRELVEVELEIRRKLNCEDEFPLHGVFATFPKWHTAHRHLNALAAGDHGGERRGNDNSLQKAAKDLQQRRGLLTHEPERLHLAAEARRKQAEEDAKLQLIRDAREDTADDLQEAVSALLK